MNSLISFLDPHMINALGWTFVHTLWQGCLIVLIMIFALQRVPSRNATLRYSIATASMISMLVAAISTFALLYFEPGQAAETASTSAVLTVATVESTSHGLVHWMSQNLSAMVTIWAIGVIVLSLRLFFGMTFIFQMKRGATDLTYALGGRAEAIAQSLNFKKTLYIAESAMVKIPVVVGHLKPMILFPLGAVNQLSPDEVEAVLAHEIAHLVRNDFLHNLIQSAIEIIFYYHPAVWWMSAVVRSERENCCDDLAIQVCGSSLTYARALVRLQEVGTSSPALALPFSGSKHHLLDRVKRILNQPQNKSNLMEKITATTLLLLCLVFASFSDGTETNRPEVDVPKLVHEYKAHFANLFVTDTIKPRTSYTMIHEEEDGKEIKLVMENGEIKSLYVDGNEIPETRYDEYKTEIDRLNNNVPVPPTPPTAPLADMPPMPPMPEMPAAAPMPDMPPMPPMPVMPAMPDMPPMPPLPPAPPAPGATGYFFDFEAPDVNMNFDFEFEIEDVYGEQSSATRSQSVIIREKDEMGNMHYRLEGDNPDIVIDAAEGVAIIDGQEVVIDSDSIIIIEEIETTPRRFAYAVAPEIEWNSEEFNKQFKAAWNQEDWNKQWKENQEEWNKHWKENWNQEEWSKQWEEYMESDEWKELLKEGSTEWKEYKEKMKRYKEDHNNDGADVKAIYEYNIARRVSPSDEVREVRGVRQRVNAEEREKRILEYKVRHDANDVRKDQGALFETQDGQLIALSSSPGTEEHVFVVQGTHASSPAALTFSADTVHYMSDSKLLELTGNVNIVQDVTISGDRLLYEIHGAEGSEDNDVLFEAITVDVLGVTSEGEGTSSEQPAVYKIKVTSTESDKVEKEKTKQSQKVKKSKF